MIWQCRDTTVGVDDGYVLPAREVGCLGQIARASPNPLLIKSAERILAVVARVWDGLMAHALILSNGRFLVDTRFQSQDGRVVGAGIPFPMNQQAPGQTLNAIRRANIHPLEFDAGCGEQLDAAAAGGLVTTPNHEEGRAVALVALDRAMRCQRHLQLGHEGQASGASSQG